MQMRVKVYDQTAKLANLASQHESLLPETVLSECIVKVRTRLMAPQWRYSQQEGCVFFKRNGTLHPAFR